MPLLSQHTIQNAALGAFPAQIWDNVADLASDTEDLPCFYNIIIIPAVNATNLFVTVKMDIYNQRLGGRVTVSRQLCAGIFPVGLIYKIYVTGTSTEFLNLASIQATTLQNIV